MNAVSPEVHLAAKADSFERSGNDGFLSQAAHGALAAAAHMEAELEKNGGRHLAPALFDLDGNMVHAKYVDSKFGRPSWGIWNNPECKGRPIAFVTESSAMSETARAKAIAKKGYTVGTVWAPAEIRGGWQPSWIRTDGGYSADNDVVSATGWDTGDY